MEIIIELEHSIDEFEAECMAESFREEPWCHRVFVRKCSSYGKSNCKPEE